MYYFTVVKRTNTIIKITCISIIKKMSITGEYSIFNVNILMNTNNIFFTFNLKEKQNIHTLNYILNNIFKSYPKEEK